MRVDREKAYQAAQKLIAKGRLDKAITEYQRVVQANPSDDRTMLKIAELQMRMRAYDAAVSTYERVGAYYASQGFSAKAMAIYKQIRVLITQHLPDSKGHYGPVVDKLANLYVEAGLTGDALATYEEYSAFLQRVGRDDEVLPVLRKIVELRKGDVDAMLKLAQVLQRAQQHEEADALLRDCGETLVGQGRRDEGLRYLDDVLQRRTDPALARRVADLYLDRNQTGDGIKALTRMQACFQSTQRDIDTLRVLARAFQAVGQHDKGLEVRKLMVRIAYEKGDIEIAQALVDELLQEAPNDPSIRSLAAHVYPDFNPQPVMPAPRGVPMPAPPPNRIAAPPAPREQAVIPPPSLPSYDLDQHEAPPSRGSYELSEDSFELIEDSIIALAGTSVAPVHNDSDDDTQTNLPHLDADYDQLVPDGDDFRNDDNGTADKEPTVARRSGPRQPFASVSQIEPDEPFPISDLEDWSDDPVPPPALLSSSVGAPRPSRGVPRPLAPAAARVPPRPQQPSVPAIVPRGAARPPARSAPDLAPPTEARLPNRGPIAIGPTRPLPNPRATAPASPRALNPHARSGVGRDVMPARPAPRAAPVQAPLPRPITPPPPPEVVVDEALEEVFEEVDFFLSQDLYDDALSLLEEQIPRYPGHPLLIERLQAIRAAKSS